MDEVYMFDEAAKLHMGKAELGGKGYGLVEMTRIGLPVPEGIIITTRMCNKFFSEKKLWPSIRQRILAKMRTLESKTGRNFGDPKNPLLVSVRSGAPLSMPGMMDTVLNLGINDEIAESMASRLGSKFAFDTYRRFMQLFGSIVLKIDRAKFEAVLEKVKSRKGIKNDSDLSGDDLRSIASSYKALVEEETGKKLEQDPEKQLFMAIQAVFESWWNKRASEYRKIYNIPDSLGTAVSIVRMVYGNYNANSGTGVAFTRDPSTGEKSLYAEVLLNAQGEDVVAGIRTPMHVDKIKQLMPKVYVELERSAKILEKYFKDMQDIEFTIEDGRFYLLQTRNGKRTPAAAVKIAIDMLNEKLISEKDALLRVEPEQLERLFYKQVDQSKKPEPIAKGLPASPGAASGRVAFSIDGAVEAKAKGIPVIMVRPETTPEDIRGIAASTGVLTSRGGMTSHAAVVTRGMGKPCIVGAESIKISADGKSFTAGSVTVKEGDIITIDGGDGSVYVGEVPLVEPRQTPEIKALLKIADKYRRLGIRANADTLEMFTKALENGAEGIGLARTERMFNSPDRLELVRRMILAKSKEERQLYLAKIKPVQKADFKAILGAANGKPVTIRLLDAPLHEFLPKAEELIPEVLKLRQKGAKKELEEKESILAAVMQLREANPMMGQRGVRLALMYPEIYEMQVSAMLEAAIDLEKQGKKVELEIMVSQVAIANELLQARQIIESTAEQVFKSTGMRIKFKIGTMIETPRATLIAADLAKYADFFSFGTNDLTQGTFAFSRDDAEAKFMPFYINNKVLESDPFVTLDAAESRLVEMCIREGKSAKPSLKVGVCGEHGGDPKSISIFNSANADYVSMSPYRVPVARLAAAQAAIKGKVSSTA
ncbi:MAG: pyruvate, phosphate dikinase [Candidatus Micrarchaeia archaeon]